MVVYVDDILIFSPSSDLVKEVMLKLQDKFKCKALGDVNFYLGLHIERDVEKRCMRVHQRKYLEALAANFGQSEGHVATPFPSGFKCVKGPEEESVGEEERRRFHSLVGSLMYAEVNTRSDVAFATAQLARAPGLLAPAAATATTAAPAATATAATATAATAAATVATTTAAPACCATMALLRVFAFDHEGRLIHVSLFDLASGAVTAPPTTADSATRSQWLTCNAAARLAIRNHLLLTECAHFGQHTTAEALYDNVFTRYSSPATAALGRLLLPYLFPELSAFAIVEDLVSHLRTSEARYRATVPAEFLDRNQPPMFITLYFIVTCLPDSLRSVRDHILSLDPTSLTVDLLDQHLNAAETTAVAVGAARGTPRPPFFEGCSPSPLAPSYASAASADVPGAEDVGVAATARARVAGVVEGAARVVVGPAVEVVEAMEVVAAVGVVEGVGALVAAVEAALGVAVVAAVGLELTFGVHCGALC
ncbi:unnamed protein product [Closterium sp. NIES-53]